jgi:hypothetical protein
VSIFGRILGWLILLLLVLWSSVSFIFLIGGSIVLHADIRGVATLLLPQLFGIGIALFYYERFWSRGVSHFWWLGVTAFFTVSICSSPGFMPLPVALYFYARSLGVSESHGQLSAQFIFAMVQFIVFWLLLYAVNRLLLPKKSTVAAG